MTSKKHDDTVRKIAIIGAGPGGICMGIRLKEAGIDDFVLLEKGGGVGGTWYHNRYPGCACDLPSFLYSFSFEPKLDWSRPYGMQPEILAYMEGIAEKYGIVPHCQFNTAVEQAEWDEARSLWRLHLAGGEVLEAEVVVSAIGMFNHLVLPNIEGLDSFAGHRFHSAQWDWDYDLAGKRVGVVGSAASAVQFIPEIVKEAGQVHLFQRTANWVIPKQDDPFTEEQLAAFAADPSIVQKMRDEMYVRVDEGMTFGDSKALAELETYGRGAIDVVEDPEVRAKLQPEHPYGCKRPLNSNVYYAAFNEPNLELVTEGIARITPSAVETEDGQSREIDLLILATGFSATKYLSAIDVRGRGGVRIEDAWEDGAAAYLGMTTAGFPNLFRLYGPNMNNGSILEMLEIQTDHIRAQIERLDRESLAWVDIKPEPMAAYNEEVQDAIAGVPVWQESCNGYYRSPTGRIVTQWPFSMSELKERASRLDEESFEAAPKGA